MNWLKKLIEFFKRLRDIRDEIKDKPVTPRPPDKPQPPANETLPENPSTPADLPNSISEHWTIGPKAYDSTWRIRWPTTFAKSPFNLGPGSFCTCNGNRAEFRSYDTDNQSKRPSYTMPLSVTLQAPVTCILYDKTGVAVGWFKSGTSGKGRLPKGDGQ